MYNSTEALVLSWAIKIYGVANAERIKEYIEAHTKADSRYWECEYQKLLKESVSSGCDELINYCEEQRLQKLIRTYKDVSSIRNLILENKIRLGKEDPLDHKKTENIPKNLGFGFFLNDFFNDNQQILINCKDKDVESKNLQQTDKNLQKITESNRKNENISDSTELKEREANKFEGIKNLDTKNEDDLICNIKKTENTDLFLKTIRKTERTSSEDLCKRKKLDFAEVDINEINYNIGKSRNGILLNNKNKHREEFNLLAKNMHIIAQNFSFIKSNGLFGEISGNNTEKNQIFSSRFEKEELFNKFVRKYLYEDKEYKIERTIFDRRKVLNEKENKIISIPKTVRKESPEIEIEVIEQKTETAIEVQTDHHPKMYRRFYSKMPEGDKFMDDNLDFLEDAYYYDLDHEKNIKNNAIVQRYPNTGKVKNRDQRLSVLKKDLKINREIFVDPPTCGKTKEKESSVEPKTIITEKLVIKTPLEINYNNIIDKLYSKRKEEKTKDLWYLELKIIIEFFIFKMFLVENSVSVEDHKKEFENFHEKLNSETILINIVYNCLMSIQNMIFLSNDFDTIQNFAEFKRVFCMFYDFYKK